MKKLSFIFASVIALGISAQAQVNLSALSYNQNFDGLGTGSAAWADNLTLAGWYTGIYNGTAVGAITAGYTSGQGGSYSSTTLYNLGVTANAERGLGYSPSSGNSGLLGLRLVNISGAAFGDIQAQFNFEQWTDAGTANVTLSYQIFGAGGGSLSTLTGWTTLGIGTSPLPLSNGTGTSGLGDTTGLVPYSFSTSSLVWNSGDELWLKWQFSKISGLTGKNPSTAIDDVVIGVVPEPSTITLAGIGLLLVCNSFRSGRKA